jgi:hypothetical protein
MLETALLDCNDSRFRKLLRIGLSMQDGESKAARHKNVTLWNATMPTDQGSAGPARHAGQRNLEERLNHRASSATRGFALNEVTH